jgi:hypothetical protein
MIENIRDTPTNSNNPLSYDLLAGGSQFCCKSARIRTVHMHCQIHHVYVSINVHHARSKQKEQRSRQEWLSESSDLRSISEQSPPTSSPIRTYLSRRPSKTLSCTNTHSKLWHPSPERQFKSRPELQVPTLEATKRCCQTRVGRPHLTDRRIAARCSSDGLVWVGRHDRVCSHHLCTGRELPACADEVDQHWRIPKWCSHLPTILRDHSCWGEQREHTSYSSRVHAIC